MAIERGKPAEMKVPKCKEEKVPRKMGPVVYFDEQSSEIRTVCLRRAGLETW